MRQRGGGDSAAGVRAVQRWHAGSACAGARGGSYSAAGVRAVQQWHAGSAHVGGAGWDGGRGAWGLHWGRGNDCSVIACKECLPTWREGFGGPVPGPAGQPGVPAVSRRERGVPGSCMSRTHGPDSWSGIMHDRSKLQCFKRRGRMHMMGVGTG